MKLFKLLRLLCFICGLIALKFMTEGGEVSIVYANYRIESSLFIVALIALVMMLCIYYCVYFIVEIKFMLHNLLNWHKKSDAQK
jgi:uncharacterized protein HemY